MRLLLVVRDSQNVGERLLPVPSTGRPGAGTENRKMVKMGQPARQAGAWKCVNNKMDEKFFLPIDLFMYLPLEGGGGGSQLDNSIGGLADVVIGSLATPTTTLLVVNKVHNPSICRHRGIRVV